MNRLHRPALLILEDGSTFHGTSIGVAGTSVGEVVFNTSITGYQEILTDPSYAQQLVALTYPHIGNVGANPEDVESDDVHCAGLIIKNLPRLHSSWRATQSLAEFLADRKVVAMADIDTRRLTRLIRTRGALKGCIAAGTDFDEGEALAKARAFAGLAGADLAREVTAKDRYEWTAGGWNLADGYRDADTGRFHVVAYDFGVKHNILRLLADRGCRITVVPATTPASDVWPLNPHGVFLSNGPGDPEPCDYAVAAIKAFLSARLPVFGICLGHQLMALASGAKTGTMKFGHHGANHPVQDVASGQVMITSQNHGFTVSEFSLPDNVRITHRSLFDQTVQGIEFTDRPAFSFQGHPEASPGPRDIACLFDRFIAMMAANRSETSHAGS